VKERKSELKVIWACLALLGAGFLGVDLSALVPAEVGETADATSEALSHLVTQRDQLTLGGYIAALGGIYTAGRSLVKAVRDWRGADGRDDPQS
jgi:hypothetical protein